MNSISRRAFIKKSMAGTAGALLSTQAFGSFSSILGANETINVAIAGFRSHGRSHINAYKNMPGVRIAALCDVDKEVLDRGVASLAKDNIKPKAYRDIRKLLEDKDVDAISVVTPNHWHALATVWACQAGKDVCVEKPVSHCIWEGRKMVEAAQKYNRIVQADLDMRSDESRHKAVAYIREGNLGKVLKVRITNYKRRRSIGKVHGVQAVPDNINYNLWLGRAPMEPLMRQNLHYDWHWQWATGNGEIGNNGPHQLDYVRWILGKNTLPKTVMSYGGRYGYLDDGETPNTQVAVYDYDGIPVIYESRGLAESKFTGVMSDFVGYTATGKKVVHPYKSESPNMNVIVFCENGYLYNTTVYDNDGKEVKRFESEREPGPQVHFIKAVRSRKKQDLRTNIEEGHLSTSLCHMGNISYSLGSHLSPNQIRDRLGDDRLAMQTFERFQEHLAANEVNIWKQPVMMGPVLQYDSTNEQFIGEFSEEANRYLKDTYRAPFVIPEKV